MSGRLRGQRALVTGAGRGLGRAVARALAREGAALELCDRTEEELERTEREVASEGGDVTLHRLDLAERERVRDLVESVLAQRGRVDVLVNNAAVFPSTPLESITDSEWQRTLAVNLTAPFLLIRGLLPSMREKGGSIVNVSSRAGVLGFAREASYCASKFGVEGLTRALAAELEGEKVSVNTVTPGLRIKPTMITDAEEARLPPGERTWNDAGMLGPAFVFLAAARGRPTGMRFDAFRLSHAIESEGFVLSGGRIEELAE